MISFRRFSAGINIKNPLRNYADNFILNNEPVRNLLAVQSRIQESQQTFFEVNLDHVVHQWLRWRELMPRIRPYYAVKCQPDPKVIQVLAALGAGFDCASKGELNLVLKTLESIYQSDSEQDDKIIVGSTNDIIFANPFKFQQDMAFARNSNVQATTFDSESELYRIQKYWPDAQLLIRVSTRIQFSAKCQLGDKFGVNSANIPHLLAKAHELGLSVIGISFHVGNMCDDFSAWPDTVEYCSEIMKLMREMGFQPQILDIGGGFPGLSSIITEEELQLQAGFEQMSRELNSALDTYYPNVGPDQISIISEPGTYFVHGALTLATEVIGKRIVAPEEYNSEFLDDPSSRNEEIVKKGSLDSFRFVDVNHLGAAKKNSDNVDESKRFVYILDDGVYGSFNILQFLEYCFPMLAVLDPEGSIKNQVNGSPSHPAKIYGPTCDLLDCITKYTVLCEVNVGDWMVWADMGAYTNASRSDFNGITSPMSYYHMSDETSRLVEQTKQNLIKQRISAIREVKDHHNIN